MNRFRLIVAGSRGFTDYARMKRELDAIGRKVGPLEVVSGAARGADRLGERYASEKNAAVRRFPADWKTYGRRAGYLRNSDMADYGHGLAAFWDGESRGTRHMIDLARAKGLRVWVIYFGPDMEIL